MLQNNLIRYENYSEDWIKVTFNFQTGGYVVAHRFHNADEIDENIYIGYILAEQGEGVELLSIIKGEKTPDAKRNGEDWEFKTVQGKIKNSIQNLIKRGKKQANRILIRIPVVNFETEELTLAIYTAIIINDKKNKRVQILDILLPDNRLIRIERKQIEDKSFIHLF